MSKRKYKGKDVEMLSVVEIIMLHVISHKDFLQGKRSTWTDAYLNNLIERIKNAYANVLGIDNVAELKKATQDLLKVCYEALELLGELKVQIENDFDEEPEKLDLIMTSLGYKSFNKKAQKGDQESLINLLFRFNENMTDELKAEIVAKGVMAETIEGITGYAETVKDLNNKQEQIKGEKKEITQAGLDELNGIYKEVIRITKISAKFFKHDKVVAQEFSYSKVLRNLNRVVKPKTNDEG